MTELTLNKCLNDVDAIIFNDVDNYKDGYEIREILEDIRKYIIDFIKNKKYNRRAFEVILQFINYMIQESYKTYNKLIYNTYKKIKISNYKI